VNYVIMGKYDKALPEAEETLRLAPDTILAYTNLGEVYLDANRLTDARATFDQALARKLDGGGLRQAIYFLDFLQGDSARMQQQLEWASGKPGEEDMLLSTQSDTEAYYGRLNNARDSSRRAVDAALRADSRETAAGWQANAALREAEVGDADAAKRGVTAALALSGGRDIKVIAALALARARDGARAKTFAEELERSFPNDIVLKLYWLPTINAAIELSKGNFSGTLVELEAAAPYELGQPPPMQLGPLYPPYLQGEAYLLSHNGAAAAAEFQKLLDHKGIVLNFIIGSLAHLQLGRAYAMAGDTVKAKSAYLDSLTLWKDADPDIPILKEAKAEYAKLQ
jgi:tetratricopeptide (TPR) repeat protein